MIDFFFLYCNFRELPKVIKRRLPSKSKKPSGKKGKRDTSNTQGKLSQSDVILIGVNAVTKALEKGPILLVLVSFMLFVSDGE